MIAGAIHDLHYGVLLNRVTDHLLTRPQATAKRQEPPSVHRLAGLAIGYCRLAFGELFLGQRPTVRKAPTVATRSCCRDVGSRGAASAWATDNDLNVVAESV